MKRTLRILLCSFCGLLCFPHEGRGEAPDALGALRRENNELRGKLLRQEAELQQLRLWLATVTREAKELSATEQEKNAIRTLQELVRRGSELASQADSVSALWRKQLNAPGGDPAEKARIALRLDELDRAVRSFYAVTRGIGNEELRKCRVIASDAELQIVILACGLEQGVFPGMIFQSIDPQRKMKLRIIGVRTGASAAEMLEGKWDDLTPGMLFTAFSRDADVR